MHKSNESEVYFLCSVQGVLNPIPDPLPPSPDIIWLPKYP